MTTLGAEAETAKRWRQVRELPFTRDHWEWRRGWRPGRRAYWFMVRLADPTVEAHARGYLADLDEPALDPPVPGFLHVSLQAVGFVDEVTGEEIDRVRRTAARIAAPPLRLRLGPVDPNPESVCLRVMPWGPITTLRAALRSAVAGVLAAGRVPGAEDHFWPHVSIGYTSTALPTGPLLDRLAALPGRPPVDVTIREVELVVLDRENRRWTWTTVGSLALGGHPQPI